MNKTEETVSCVATDQECLNKAKSAGKQVTVVRAPVVSDSVKCVVTDTGCLKQAKAQGKKVEIVDEAQLDTFRCAVTDADCLTRAKSMGKKVEIIGCPPGLSGVLSGTHEGISWYGPLYG